MNRSTATTAQGSSGVTRVAALDCLRAVAAIGVLLGHAYSLGGRVAPLRAERWYDTLLHASTSGVWLFFVISGYIVSRPFVHALVHGDALPGSRIYFLKRGVRI